jgi:hypothetical protein
MLGRQGDNGGGPGDRNQHDDEGEQEKQRRNMTANALARAQCLFHQAQAGIPERSHPASAQQPKVSGNQGRHDQLKPEHLRP